LRIAICCLAGAGLKNFALEQYMTNGERLIRTGREILLVVAFALGMAGMVGAAQAQTTPGAQSPSGGTTPPPAAPAASPPPAAVPGSSGPQVNGGSDEDAAASDAQSIDLAARPVAMLSGKAEWADGYQTLMDAFGKIRTEMGKAGLTASGRPLTVFLDTDDQSFSYNAMIPVSGGQAGQTQLANGVALGTSPAGKTLKFQHQGAYDDIDATYEAITAYLDEKGLEAKNLFVEQYLNDAAGSDDPALQVDIYVFLKE
jgi:effector-binding domain-containing protein